MDTTSWGMLVLALLSLSAGAGASLIDRHKVGRRILGAVSLVSGTAAIAVFVHALAPGYPRVVLVVIGVCCLGSLGWLALSWSRRRRLRRRMRMVAIQTIVADYNKLACQPEEGRRETLKSIHFVALQLWKKYSRPRERGKDQPLTRAWSTIATIQSEPGDIPLEQLEEAVLLIAGLEDQEWAVLRCQ